ncbi:MAG: hypothetical protein AAF899_20305, partial [Pseudomonadota bacterium]
LARRAEAAEITDATGGEAGRLVLTVDAYEALGGLSGLAARQAERAVLAHGADTGEALTRLIVSLVDMPKGGHEGADAPLVRREAEMLQVTLDPDAERLVDDLINARVLVREDTRLRLALPDMLRVWPRARQILDSEAPMLATRGTIEPLAARWSASGEASAQLLPAGPLLRSAQDLRLARRVPTSPQLRRFIDRSADRVRHRRLGLAAAGVIGLTAAGAIGAIIAIGQPGPEPDPLQFASNSVGAQTLSPLPPDTPMVDDRGLFPPAPLPAPLIGLADSPARLQDPEPPALATAPLPTTDPAPEPTQTTNATPPPVADDQGEATDRLQAALADAEARISRAEAARERAEAAERVARNALAAAERQRDDAATGAVAAVRARQDAMSALEVAQAAREQAEADLAEAEAARDRALGALSAAMAETVPLIGTILTAAGPGSDSNLDRDGLLDGVERIRRTLADGLGDAPPPATDPAAALVDAGDRLVQTGNAALAISAYRRALLALDRTGGSTALGDLAVMQNRIALAALAAGEFSLIALALGSLQHKMAFQEM